MNKALIRKTIRNYGTTIKFFPDDDEPPLTEDEIRGLEIADREISEGKAVSFDEAFKDLW